MYAGNLACRDEFSLSAEEGLRSCANLDGALPELLLEEIDLAGRSTRVRQKRALVEMAADLVEEEDHCATSESQR